MLFGLAKLHCNTHWQYCIQPNAHGNKFLYQEFWRQYSTKKIQPIIDESTEQLVRAISYAISFTSCWNECS